MLLIELRLSRTYVRQPYDIFDLAFQVVEVMKEKGNPV